MEALYEHGDIELDLHVRWTSIPGVWLTSPNFSTGWADGFSVFLAYGVVGLQTKTLGLNQRNILWTCIGQDS